MTTLTRWDPFRLMRWPDIWDDEDWSVASRSNNLDVYETEDEVVIRANVAGIDDESVDITFEKGVLWIRAEAEQEVEEEDKKYYQKSARSYSYKVAVPGNIDLKQEPNAEMSQGMVSVRFKKAEEAKPKRIAVKKRG